jgi:hypothetical protein
VDFFGSKGVISIELESMLLLRYSLHDLTPFNIAHSSLSTSFQILKGVTSNALEVLIKQPFLGHDIMIENYVDSLLNNTDVPVLPAEGRETVRMLENIANQLTYYSRKID